MQALQGGEDAVHRLDQLEAHYYELQLHLYETQFEVLKWEGLLLTTQRESLQRQITGGFHLLSGSAAPPPSANPAHLRPAWSPKA